MEIVVDAGATTRTWEVAATAAGRRVEVSSGRGMVTVTEVTRGGTPVRTAQFMASRVLALVEHPAPRHAPDGRAPYRSRAPPDPPWRASRSKATAERPRRSGGPGPGPVRRSG